MSFLQEECRPRCSFLRLRCAYVETGNATFLAMEVKMLFDADLSVHITEGAKHFTSAAAVALGQSFALRFMPWLTRAWNWLRGRPSSSSEANSSISEPLDDSTGAELGAELQHATDDGHWDDVVEGLKLAGVPIDTTAAEQLDSLRDDLLRKATNAPQAVTRLGSLTAEAFERAGIGKPDLDRWQNITERLKDDAPEPVVEAKPVAQPAAVGVARIQRPSTWFVWSRQETDRRQLHFTRRAVRNCRAACEQALSSMRDFPSLRQVRDFNGQLVMIEELLDTTPPLEPRSARFKLDSQTVKSLLQSLEEAVLTAERLTQETAKLFCQQPSTSEWQQAISACLRSTSKLSQLVRDRRTVR